MKVWPPGAMGVATVKTLSNIMAWFPNQPWDILRETWHNVVWTCLYCNRNGILSLHPLIWPALTGKKWTFSQPQLSQPYFCPLGSGHWIRTSYSNAEFCDQPCSIWQILKLKLWYLKERLMVSKDMNNTDTDDDNHSHWPPRRHSNGNAW